MSNETQSRITETVNRSDVVAAVVAEWRDLGMDACSAKLASGAGVQFQFGPAMWTEDVWTKWAKDGWVRVAGEEALKMGASDDGGRVLIDEALVEDVRVAGGTFKRAMVRFTVTEGLASWLTYR